MNSINLIGNICNDLELKSTSNGKYVCSFSLAVKRPHVKDTTDFLNVVVWNQSAEYLSKYAHKGDRISVSGVLTSRNYEDKNGNKRTAFEVVSNDVSVLERKKLSSDASQSPSYMPDAYASDPQFELVGENEELPF